MTGFECKILNSKELDDWNREYWGGNDPAKIGIDDLKFLADSEENARGFSDDGEYSHSIQLTSKARSFVKELLNRD